MGNSSSKDQRRPSAIQTGSRGASFRNPASPASGTPRDAATIENAERPFLSLPSRSGRGSRADLTFLGIGGHHEREAQSTERRKLNRQEREAIKKEAERAERLKERERSMREEHVDGGYLVTQGVYVGAEDYNKPIVRQLMVNTGAPVSQRSILIRVVDRKTCCSFLERTKRSFGQLDRMAIDMRCPRSSNTGP